MYVIIFTILSWVGLDPIQSIADICNTNQQSMKLLLSLFMSYLTAYIYDKFVRKATKSRPHLQTLYFIVTGLDMAYLNFGASLIHNAIPVFVFYATHLFFTAGKVTSYISFIFNISYLVIGYYNTESESYDISWTMPHCVLTLKLIALSFDLWDGKKLNMNKEISANQKKTAITELPSLYNMFGYVFFPSCYLVGPIFSYKRYDAFTSDKYPLDDPVITADRYKQTVSTLLMGILCIIIHQVGGIVFNMNYMESEEFSNHSIFYRQFYCGLWGYITLSKYISCWLLTEGSCMLFGLSYNGTEKNEHKWDGCKNIKPLLFLTSTKFQDYIDSFNCNTNYFAAEYIYKRLKFLGNKHLSQASTLFFLALWHGINSGYYVTFFNEFVIMYMEKEFEDLMKKTKLYDLLTSIPGAHYVIFILLKMYTLVFMGYSLVPFDVKVYNKWFAVYAKLWFLGTIVFVPWGFCYKPALKTLLKKYNLYK